MNQEETIEKEEKRERKNSTMTYNGLSELDVVRTSISANNQYFQIYVDSILAVSKTNNIKSFDNWKKVLSTNSKRLLIEVYKNNLEQNRTSAKHVFLLEKKTKNEAVSTSTLDLKSIINEEIERAKGKWDRQRLEEENEALKKEIVRIKKIASRRINEAEEETDEVRKEMEEIASKQLAYIEQLKNALEAAEEQRRNYLGMSEMTGAFITGLREFKKANPDDPFSKTLNGLPIKKLFNEYPEKIGIPKEDVNDSIPIENEQDENAHAGKRTDIPPDGFDDQAVKFWRQIKGKMDADMFMQVPVLVNKMADDPAFAKDILSFL